MSCSSPQRRNWTRPTATLATGAASLRVVIKPFHFDAEYGSTAQDEPGESSAPLMPESLWIARQEVSTEIFSPNKVLIYASCVRILSTGQSFRLANYACFRTNSCRRYSLLVRRGRTTSEEQNFSLLIPSINRCGI